MSEMADGDCSRFARNGARVVVAGQCGVVPEDIVCAQQVHGCRIARALEHDRGRGSRHGLEPFPETDAVITSVKGLPLAVSVADCVPVLLFNPVAETAGIVHAGRQGTFENIAAKTVAEMTRLASSPRDVFAVIGPSAGPCCYEVSAEMAEDWARRDLPRQGRHLDLWAANAFQLVAAGVPASHIEIAGICTVCGGRFFSYRRGDNTLRNMAILSM
jgi:hypothetical protein